MKRLLLILSIFCFVTTAFGQQYYNEWIDYNKTYYKFKIGTTGLFRIPQSVLAGANLATTDVAQFQLWRNGVEVPIYTSNQAGVLASGGYIEFWGEINDGKVDLPLYRNAADQINNQRNLFQDSATYFLTVNPAGSNRRLAPTANNIPTGVGAEPYFMHTSGTYPNETIHLGPYRGLITEPAYSASFEGGEGWTSSEISENQTRPYTQSNLYPYTGSGAPNMQVAMNVVGNSPTIRKVQLQLNNSFVFDTTLNQFDYAKLTRVLPVTTLTGTTENLSVTNVAGNVPNNRIKVAFIEITYPRAFNFGGASNFRFKLTPNSTLGKYLEISNFNYSGTPVLYDLTNGTRYEVNTVTPSVLKVYVQPAAGTTQELVLVNEAASNINTITALQTRNFTNYTAPANQGDYLIITNNAILNGSNGSTPVEDYRAYRASAAGGSYNAKVYLIDQLTDQFAYGIRFSPLAVRNFLSYARNKYAVAPKSVFIAGRAVKYVDARFYDSNVTPLMMVPTFGQPSSDVLLAAEGSSSVPLTPIGRISVINGNELAVYLEKVKQYEAGLTPVSNIDGSSWKKNIAHIVGANDQPTINSLYEFLNQNKATISDTLWGANVSDFVKNISSNASQQSNADRLSALINSGIGLLSYFGHSSANTLGFNLEDPASYNNQGKYPLFNMMGCNVGDIFTGDGGRLSAFSTISEKYVLAKERGCIGMMAGTSFGYVSPLKLYNDQFYNAMARGNYGNTVGALMQQTIRNTFVVMGGENDLLQRAQCEEFVLNGDPAIKLYEFAKPDYAIEDPLVAVNPTFVSIAEQNFTVAAKIMNLGKAINRKVVVELKRTYPNLTTRVIQRDTIEGIRYTDSLTFTVPIDPINDKGLNKITVTIDPDNTIDELFKTNNSITKEITIYEDELRPIYPYNYAIVNKSPITFYASTADPLAPSKSYIMEVDTTALFNSSSKVSLTKTSIGGILDFNPSLNLKDSTVYYWRTATVAAQNEQPKWSNSSFVYINGSETGYNQSHYYQFANNSYSQMSLDSANRLFVFNSKRNTITVNNTVWIGNNTQEENLRIYINDIPPYIASACDFGLVFNILDGKSFVPWKNEPQGNGLGRYDSRYPVCNNGNGQAIYNFEYDNTADGRNKVLQFLKNIPNGDLIVFRVVVRGETQYAPDWKNDIADNTGNNLYNEFVKQGFTTIDSFNRLRAVTFAYKQNGLNTFSPVINMGNTAYDAIPTTFNFSTFQNNGSFTSPAFGPAKAWKQLQWDGYSQETNSKDSVAVDVIGVKNDGTEDVLLTGIGLDKKITDVSSIDAKTYPNLKLRMNSWDNVTYTPYQLKYWRLYNTPAPEGAIAPNIYVSTKDTLDAGEPLNLGVAFKNISNYPFDSVKVKLTIRDKNNRENIISLPRQKALVAADTIKLQVPVATKSYGGANQLYVEFNPDDDQPEQYHFNNFLYKNFYVRSDSLNPYMDVTFDGLHILNKDIVSSKPDILIKLTDDARYLLLNNTDLVKVQLRYPDGSLHDYNFNSDTLVLTPPGQGTNDANTATVNFKPHLLQDGEYSLVVSGKDESGNTAGNINYSIAFQVLNKPMISNLLNYPNPFTTSTAFVFTLTGSEIPQNIRIQILTITGKIVREITKAELGPLHIGRNITEFKWDGTDQYGQKLANGVYIYRVLTNLNGKALDKYSTDANNTDKYFNKGYGKMVLIR